MKIVIVSHFVAEGQFDVAMDRIRQVGERMAKHPGFSFRHVGPLDTDPTCIATVTGWHDAASCASWNESSKRNPLPPAAVPAYRKVETAEFDSTR